MHTTNLIALVTYTNLAIAKEASSTAEYEVTEMDLVTVESLIKLNLQRLVELWLRDPASNNGLVIYSSGAYAADVQPVLSLARLTIRYGFCPVTPSDTSP